MCTLECHESSWAIVNAVAVTMDGRHAVSAWADNTLKVWDLERGEALLTLEGHTDHVDAVAVTRDGRHVVSGSSDKTLKVWDMVDGTLVASFGGESPLFACAVAPDCRTIVAGHAGGVHILRLQGIWPPAEGVT